MHKRSLVKLSDVIKNKLINDPVDLIDFLNYKMICTAQAVLATI